MTTLDPKDGYLTLINRLTVDPDCTEELLEALSRATEETMRPLPGFISANLHISQDRTRVANYAQWRSKADYDAMATDQAAVDHMRQAGAIAEAFDPVFYELRSTHTAQESG